MDIHSASLSYPPLQCNIVYYFLKEIKGIAQ